VLPLAFSLVRHSPPPIDLQALHICCISGAAPIMEALVARLCPPESSAHSVIAHLGSGDLAEVSPLHGALVSFVFCFRSNYLISCLPSRSRRLCSSTATASFECQTWAEQSRTHGPHSTALGCCWWLLRHLHLVGWFSSFCVICVSPVESDAE
jgi:hypothetical protein